MVFNLSPAQTLHALHRTWPRPLAGHRDDSPPARSTARFSALPGRKRSSQGAELSAHGCHLPTNYVPFVVDAIDVRTVDPMSEESQYRVYDNKLQTLPAKQR